MKAIMEDLNYYRLLSERENYRDRMRMAKNYNSKDIHAIHKRLFRMVRNKLVIFMNGDSQ